MAHLSPDTIFATRQHAGLYRELDVLDRLKKSLPVDNEVFHSITWHRVHERQDHHGEIDVVFLVPTLNILLIEVKSGDLITHDGGLYKLYGLAERDVAKQSRIQYGAVVNLLQEAGMRPSIINCVVLPDFRLGKDIAILSLARERIIDTDDYDQLGTCVRTLLSLGSATVDVNAVRHFMRNEFRVGVDLSTMQTQLRGTVQHLSDGLATWVSRMQAPSGCFRIEATAGSGKTQLALRLMQDAVAQNRSVLYVCFNRALADHIGKIAPDRAQGANFHELCIDHYRRKHGEPDFSSPSIFNAATSIYLKEFAAMPARLDVLIVDEGQDFEPTWLEGLASQLHTSGTLYLLDDPDQRLYDNLKDAAKELPVTITS